MSEKIHKRRAPRASANTWVVVLAAGDGRRLHQLTTNESGVPVPKQFCSLNGGPSLLRSALRRAETVASPHRICTVVAEQHRHWWQPALTPAEHANVIVQPRNRGTANGILLPLLHIMRRDPQARVVLLPSDHYVDDEAVLATIRELLTFLPSNNLDSPPVTATQDDPARADSARAGNRARAKSLRTATRDAARALSLGRTARAPHPPAVGAPLRVRAHPSDQ